MTAIKAVHGLALKCLLPLVLFVSCGEQKKAEDKHDSISATGAQLPQDFIHTNTVRPDTTTNVDNRILCILQDTNANYWYGTNGGAYRYDGRTLTVFTTKDGLFQNMVLDIQEDESGNIWFATGGYGVNRFDGRNMSTLTVTEDAQPNIRSEGSWKIDPGDLWFQAGGGVFRYYNGTFTYLRFPQPDFKYPDLPQPAYQLSAYGVYSTLKDSRGILWFGTQAMGVCRYDGTSFTWLVDKGLRGPAVLEIIEDRDGNIWFGNNGNGLFRYDGRTLINLTEEKGLGNPEFIRSGKKGPGTLARVLAICEDDTGDLWIGTADAGVWRYDGTQLTNYETKDGLPHAGIETIHKDNHGELWFGTNGDGVYKFDGQRFSKYHLVTDPGR